MRHLLLFSVLLLGTCWAAAQDTSPSAASSTQDASAQATPTDAGNAQTVKGCLSGSDGNYILEASNGKTYRLMGDTSKLSEHVGHEMKITGTISSTSTTAPNGQDVNGANTTRQTLEVTSFKHISKNCEGGGMSK